MNIMKNRPVILKYRFEVKNGFMACYIDLVIWLIDPYKPNENMEKMVCNIEILFWIQKRFYGSKYWFDYMVIWSLQTEWKYEKIGCNIEISFWIQKTVLWHFYFAYSYCIGYAFVHINCLLFLRWICLHTPQDEIALGFICCSYKLNSPGGAKTILKYCFEVKNGFMACNIDLVIWLIDYYKMNQKMEKTGRNTEISFWS